MWFFSSKTAFWDKPGISAAILPDAPMLNARITAINCHSNPCEFSTKEPIPRDVLRPFFSFSQVGTILRGFFLPKKFYTALHCFIRPISNDVPIYVLNFLAPTVNNTFGAYFYSTQKKLGPKLLNFILVIQTVAYHSLSELLHPGLRTLDSRHVKLLGRSSKHSIDKSMERNRRIYII